jgi:xanthine dehydrogenase accessory factor
VQKQLLLWQFVQKELRTGNPVVLLYVLESTGSSPGRQGFGMAVTQSGDMYGSIGGGMMEHKLVELAKTYFTSNKQEIFLHKQIHNKAAVKNQSGMICSGEQSVYLQTMGISDEKEISLLVDSLLKEQNGTLEITPGCIRFYNTYPEADFDFRFRDESDFIYQEKTGFRQHLYIVGGGHCALALSKLMRSLDFKIHLIEERPQLNTLLQNEYAHEIIIINDYTETEKYIPNGESNYSVIMTFGYRTDALAVRTLQHKKLAYLGMLGSRNKIDTLFQEMEQEDVLSKFETFVRAPIGIAIKSRTPEEIAISIAAEIIQVKNRNLL